MAAAGARALPTDNKDYPPGVVGGQTPPANCGAKDTHKGVVEGQAPSINYLQAAFKKYDKAANNKMQNADRLRVVETQLRKLINPTQWLAASQGVGVSKYGEWGTAFTQNLCVFLVWYMHTGGFPMDNKKRPFDMDQPSVPIFFSF